MIPDSNELAQGSRDIVVQERNGHRLRRVSRLHPATMDFTYPILFPSGTIGWHDGILLYTVAHEVVDDEDSNTEKPIGRGVGARGGLRRITSEREFYLDRLADHDRQRTFRFSDRGLQLESMYHHSGRLFSAVHRRCLRSHRVEQATVSAPQPMTTTCNSVSRAGRWTAEQRSHQREYWPPGGSRLELFRGPRYMVQQY